ncbi:MAG: helix-hairpin-helix domain-containing protein [Ktedonobacterales bacterium]
MFQFAQTVQLVSEQGEPVTVGTPHLARVSNQQVAEVLFNIATLLEMQQANPYRIAAYRTAARSILSLAEPAAQIVARGQALQAPGLGERLRRKITELITTGRMTFYDDLCEESLPDEVRALMRVEHIGPRTALRLTGHLGVHSIEQLYQVAHAHLLRQHYGFGVRSEARIEAAAATALTTLVVTPEPTPFDAVASADATEPLELIESGEPFESFESFEPMVVRQEAGGNEAQPLALAAHDAPMRQVA